jgi:hypothetical protein
MAGPRWLLFLVLLPAGCSAFDAEADLGLVLPAPPAHWQRAFPVLGARIVFPNATGRMQEVSMPDWGTPGAIACPKTGTTPVLAFPVTGRDGPEGGFPRPAGGLYPSSLGADGRTLELSWVDGAVGHVLMLARSRGIDCSLFNARRLSTYMGRCADPWDLDLEGIAERIARGSFTAFDIDALPGRDQAMSIGQGEWFLESPFRGALFPDQQGTLLLRGLSDGVHALFSVEGGRLRLASSSLGVLVSGPR